MYLLRLVIEGPEQFWLGELAERAGLPVSSVHRLLRAMLAEGLVERGDGQSYRVGRELLRLSSRLAARFDPVRTARPLLADLARTWAETAVLCLYSPSRRRAVVAAIEQAPHIRYTPMVEDAEIELPWGSLGQAILANLPAGESEAIFRGADRSPLAGRPRSERIRFADQMQQVRDHGTARYLDEEFDMAGIAAPVFGSGGTILGSIGVIMPLSRFRPAKEDDLRRDVSEAAAVIGSKAAPSASA